MPVKNIGKWWSIIRRQWWLLLPMLLFVCFPFLLDYGYGRGYFRKIPHSFKGEVWFAFLGSYMPSTIFGIITIFQAIIIQQKEKENRILRERYRFRLRDNCVIERYDKEEMKIGKYDYARFGQISKGHIQRKEFEKFLLFECYVEDVLGRNISNVTEEKLEWNIGGKKKYVQNDPCYIFSSFSRAGIGQKINIFWRFTGENSDEAYIEISRVFSNYYTKNSEYDDSVLSVEFTVRDDEQSKQNVIVKINARGGEDDSIIESDETSIRGR